MRLLILALDGVPFDVFSRLSDELHNMSELRNGEQCARWIRR